MFAPETDAVLRSRLLVDGVMKVGRVTVNFQRYGLGVRQRELRINWASSPGLVSANQAEGLMADLKRAIEIGRAAQKYLKENS